MTHGITTDRRSWKIYDRKPRVAFVPVSPEVKARTGALMDEALERIASGRSLRGMEKIKDREARVAVEGDTDGNHDNFEPAQ